MAQAIHQQTNGVTIPQAACLPLPYREASYPEHALMSSRVNKICLRGHPVATLSPTCALELAMEQLMEIKLAELRGTTLDYPQDAEGALHALHSVGKTMYLSDFRAALEKPLDTYITTVISEMNHMASPPPETNPSDFTPISKWQVLTPLLDQLDKYKKSRDAFNQTNTRTHEIVREFQKTNPNLRTVHSKLQKLVFNARYKNLQSEKHKDPGKLDGTGKMKCLVAEQFFQASHLEDTDCAPQTHVAMRSSSHDFTASADPAPTLASNPTPASTYRPSVVAVCNNIALHYPQSVMAFDVFYSNYWDDVKQKLKRDDQPVPKPLDSIDLASPTAPIHTLSDAYREGYRTNPPMKRLIKSVEKNFTGFIPIRGDGNCFFRSVLFAHVSQNGPDVMLDKLQHMIDFLNTKPVHDVSHFSCQLIDRMIKQWRDDPDSMLSDIRKNKKLDLAIIQIMRHALELKILENPEIQGCKPSEFIWDGQSLADVARSAGIMGEFCNDLTTSLFSLIFGLNIHIVSSSPKQNDPFPVQRVENAILGDRTVAVIFGGQGHYDGLIAPPDTVRSPYEPATLEESALTEVDRRASTEHIRDLAQQLLAESHSRKMSKSWWKKQTIFDKTGWSEHDILTYLKKMGYISLI